jgi:hypothetical protein
MSQRITLGKKIGMKEAVAQLFVTRRLIVALLEFVKVFDSQTILNDREEVWSSKLFVALLLSAPFAEP